MNAKECPSSCVIECPSNVTESFWPRQVRQSLVDPNSCPERHYQRIQNYCTVDTSLPVLFFATRPDTTVLRQFFHSLRVTQWHDYHYHGTRTRILPCIGTTIGGGERMIIAMMTMSMREIPELSRLRHRQRRRLQLRRNSTLN
jgi:hypothetical protein